MSRKHHGELCHPVAVCISYVTNMARMCGNKYQTRHEPTLLCSSRVKTEQAWLRHKKLQFEVNKMTSLISIILWIKFKSSLPIKYLHVFWPPCVCASYIPSMPTETTVRPMMWRQCDNVPSRFHTIWRSHVFWSCGAKPRTTGEAGKKTVERSTAASKEWWWYCWERQLCSFNTTVHSKCCSRPVPRKW